jgi:hypothetical protein
MLYHNYVLRLNYADREIDLAFLLLLQCHALCGNIGWSANSAKSRLTCRRQNSHP